MKAFDASLASPFRIEWLVPLDVVTQDDYSRGIAEKAETILRSARFIAQHQADASADMEIRIWIEAANAPACVSITWEPGAEAFGFHLLDESLRERLACVVFRDVPCIDAEASDAQLDDILRAALDAVRSAEERDALRIAESVRNAPGRRVPVLDGSVDHGIEP